MSTQRLQIYPLNTPRPLDCSLQNYEVAVVVSRESTKGVSSLTATLRQS